MKKKSSTRSAVFNLRALLGLTLCLLGLVLAIPALRPAAEQPTSYMPVPGTEPREDLARLKQYHAIGLDVRPRRVRLPFAGQGQSNANPHANSFTHTYTIKAYPNSGTSPDAATSTLDVSSDARSMMQPQKNESCQP